MCHQCDKTNKILCLLSLDSKSLFLVADNKHIEAEKDEKKKKETETETEKMGKGKKNSAVVDSGGEDGKDEK